MPIEVHIINLCAGHGLRISWRHVGIPLRSRRRLTSDSVTVWERNGRELVDMWTPGETSSNTAGFMGGLVLAFGLHLMMEEVIATQGWMRYTRQR